MDRKPPDRDNALLERLNALKKSSVSFDTSLHPLQQPEDRPQQPHEVADITARFRNLKSSRQNDPDALIASIAEAPSSADDAPPSPTIEELIADLGPEEQWQLDQDDTTRIHTLLQDSKEALSATTTTANNEVKKERDHQSAAIQPNHPNSLPNSEHPTQGSKRASSSSSSANDEEEAAMQLQRILDELDLHTDPLPANYEPSSPHPHHISPSLSSTPHTSLPQPPNYHPLTTTNPEIDTFPSVPSTFPSPPKHMPSSPAPTTAKHGFTDAEIASWCIICCADAVVRCTGCAGDLYCWGCWGEGHRGEGAGREERGHRWVGVGAWKGRKGGGGGGGG